MQEFTSTCALTNDGEALCWGQGDTGQLGQGLDSHTQLLSQDGSRYPLKVVDMGEFIGGRPLRGIRQINAGESHTCALTYDKKVFCWGGGAFLGNLV